jgi:hypothetical protein
MSLPKRSLRANVYTLLAKGSWSLLKGLGYVPRKHILIDCSSPTHYHHIKPVVDRMIKDGLVQVSVLAHQQFSPGPRESALIAPARFVGTARARLRIFDMTIALEPYLASVPNRGLAVYAPHGAGMKVNYSTGEKMAAFDVVLAVDRERAAAQQPHLRAGARLVEAGFIVTESSPPSVAKRGEILASLGLTANRPLVLYTPSWSKDTDLILLSDAMLRALAQQRQWNVILRPHPNLMNPEWCGGKNWRAVIERYVSSSFALADDQFEPAQTFMSLSDVLIGDYSSTIYEYLFFDRPIVIQRAPRVVAQFAGQRASSEIEGAAHSFSEPGEAVGAIAEALRDSLLYSPRRQAILKERYFNVGCATVNVVRTLYRELGISNLEVS